MVKKLLLTLLISNAFMQSAQAGLYDPAPYQEDDNSQQQNNPMLSPEKEAMPPLHGVDVTTMMVSGVRLRMTPDEAETAAQANALMRSIKRIRSQEREGEIRSLSWGSADEETVVTFMKDVSQNPPAPLVETVTYTFVHPEALLSVALQRFGEPSKRIADKSKYIWCEIDSARPERCDKAKPSITVDTASVEGIGKITMTDPRIYRALVNYTPPKDQILSKKDDAGQNSALPVPGF